MDVVKNTTLMAQWDLIPESSKVLEIGPGPGHMTEALYKKKCDVTAIEINPEYAPFVQPFCQRLIITDVEHLDMDSELRFERFNVILLGDVLEHLRFPEHVLLALKGRLSSGGFLVASIPNVAHASVRLAILEGKFDYQSCGLLDSTHLRFFTIQSIYDAFQNAGYVIQDLKRIRKGFFDTSISVDPARVHVSVLKKLCEDQEAQTYQFVFKAVPEEPSIRKHTTGISFVDLTWSRHRAVKELSIEYMGRGWMSFWKNPPNVYQARQMYYRAFALSPQPKALVYIIASFLPRRFLSAIHWVHSQLKK